MATLKPQSNKPLYSNTAIGTLAVDGWGGNQPIAEPERHSSIATKMPKFSRILVPTCLTLRNVITPLYPHIVT